MLRGRPGVYMLDDFLRLDEFLMMDDLSGVGQHLGRTRYDPIFVTSYMIWTTTQGRDIIVSHPHQIVFLPKSYKLKLLSLLDESESRKN